MIDPIELQQIRENIKPLVLTTGEFIRTNFGKVRTGQADEKDLNSLVSFVDIEAEKRLVDGLSKLLPNANFLTEEETALFHKESEISWIIDPLDGTTNFLSGVPVFAISIALKVGDSILFGVVYDVMRDLYYDAIRGQGGTVNGVSLKCTDTRKWEEAIVATGFPYKVYEADHPMFSILRDVIRTARGMRRLGSAALDLAYVASGVFDVYYEARLNPWDIAAGMLLVEEAGGRTTDFFDGQSSLANGTVIASNTYLHESIKEIISDAGLTSEMLD